MGVSITGITGKTKDIQGEDGFINAAHNTRSWALGGEIEYQDWTLGLEYIDNGRSHVNTTHLDRAKAGNVFTVAASKTFDDHKVTVGYYHSTRKMGAIKDVAGPERIVLQNAPAPGANLGTSKANVYSLTYDYKVAEGLSLFAEANYFNLKTTDNALRYQNSIHAINEELEKGVGSNKGHAFLVGTKINF